MLRRTIYHSRTLPIYHCNRHPRPFSASFKPRSDVLPSLLEDASSPLEVTTVLRSGQGFKIRTRINPDPHTVHGNLIILHGEYFLWKPQLHSPQPGVLDIAPEAWGILDVISPKPGNKSPPRSFCGIGVDGCVE